MSDEWECPKCKLSAVTESGECQNCGHCVKQDEESDEYEDDLEEFFDDEDFQPLIDDDYLGYED